jgi:hypothetical protein
MNYAMLLTRQKAQQFFHSPNNRFSPDETIPYGVICMEKSTRLTLKDYLSVHFELLRKNPERKENVNYRLKVVIFQVLYTLMTICKSYQSFRHNDLHLTNILMISGDRSKTTHLRYLINQKWFSVDMKNSRVPIIIDFGLSAFDDKIVQPMYKNNRRNQYVDVNKFFNSLISFLTPFKTSINSKMWKFMTVKAVPDTYRRGDNRYFSIVSKSHEWLMLSDNTPKVGIEPPEYTTPEKLLKKSIFRELLEIVETPFEPSQDFEADFVVDV